MLGTETALEDLSASLREGAGGCFVTEKSEKEMRDGGAGAQEGRTWGGCWQQSFLPFARGL